MKIDLIQPRHSYAPAQGLGHIYMPTSLLTAGARLLAAGVDVEFHDENITGATITSDNVGVNLLGAPYIPEVIKLQQRIRKDYGDKTFFIGGQVVSGLDIHQRTRLFGDSTYSGNDDATLAEVLGIDIKSLSFPSQTSLIPAYEKINDPTMKEYLSREFSLSVSQGCKFSCNFCAAVRTFKHPITGKTMKVTESYRDIDIIKVDLQYLVRRAASYGLDQLQLYMSNLDVFQTPRKLLEFAYAVQDVRNNNPQVGIRLRGLATVGSFIDADTSAPRSIEELIRAGFHTVGFGVDGWGKEEWAALRKGHNTEEECLGAIRVARENYGITPEILMVFGNPRTTKKDSIKAALHVTEMVVTKYGAIPRPHVSKDFIPGNDGWLKQEYAEAVENLMQHPGSFQSLDFTALPSPLTHPNKRIRELATEYFLKMCELPGNTTQWVKPITPGLSRDEIELIKNFNEGRFDR